MIDESNNAKPNVEHSVVMDQGSSLLPMLIAGLVMITIGMAVAFAFV